MPSPKLKNILKQTTAFLSGAAHAVSSRPARRIIGIFGSWWRAIAVFLALVMFLYYPLGGWLIEDITPILRLKSLLLTKISLQPPK